MLPARAATFNVDRFDDSAGSTACADGAPNDCSLRGAITAAHALPGPDIVTVPAGTYTLTIPSTAFEDVDANGDLHITDSLTLVGAGAATTIIQACDADPPATCLGINRVLDVVRGTVTIGGVTIRHRHMEAFADNVGGGVRNRGTLTVADSVISGTAAANASGTSAGGGIANLATLTVMRSTVTGNAAGLYGGGIYNPDAVLILMGSSVRHKHGRERWRCLQWRQRRRQPQPQQGRDDPEHTTRASSAAASTGRVRR